MISISQEVMLNIIMLLFLEENVTKPPSKKNNWEIPQLISKTEKKTEHLRS